MIIICERKDHNKKAEWLNMETELQMLEEGSPVNIHPDELKATLKKIANWKTLGLDGITELGLKSSPLFTTGLLRE